MSIISVTYELILVTEQEESREDVVFLLGAGASMDAGIPDTYGFVSEFIRYIEAQHQPLTKMLLDILAVRETFNRKTGNLDKYEVDVEQLLATLRDLINKEQVPLLDFYSDKKFCLDSDPKSFLELKNLLEAFIRAKVIVEKESSLTYLQELLKFETPIEIFSTNYDTCIEQISYLSHRRYTDGFDIYWNEGNFKASFDVKHYKLHGSVIWYENKKTKECVKIPVHSNSNEGLRLIYGEAVEPLLIYPAQKSEYVEPLTDLQVLFKKKLFNHNTKLLIVVGYSFRDNYLVHMLWDAARANEDLHVILVSPDAQSIFDKKLRFINIQTRDESRIANRVICLSYPFATVLQQLRNHYIGTLKTACKTEKESIADEDKYGSTNRWVYLARWCIDAEFSTLAESALEKSGIEWKNLESQFIGPFELSIFAVKALLHSVIANDEFIDKWLQRVNSSFQAFDIDKLTLAHFDWNKIGFNFSDKANIINSETAAKSWVEAMISERDKKLVLLGDKYAYKLKSTKTTFERLETLKNRLLQLQNIEWKEYYKLNPYPEIEKMINPQVTSSETLEKARPDLKQLVLDTEKIELGKIYQGKTFRFILDKAIL